MVEFKQNLIWRAAFDVEVLFSIFTRLKNSKWFTINQSKLNITREDLDSKRIWYDLCKICIVLQE